ncbi:MAG: hypothetical protein IIC18_11900, partial [Bacteroidetes bacterium]|nr:hypothetical protein [Bacteroidota bacterium]
MCPLYRIVFLLAVVAVGLGAEGATSAQGKPPEGTVYTWVSAPLETALFELADLSGIAVVFAHRLVDRRVVTASYKVGDDPRSTLEAMLADTGLRAERIRRGRYVIISEPLNVLFDTNDPAAFTGTIRGN